MRSVAPLTSHIPPFTSFYYPAEEFVRQLAPFVVLLAPHIGSSFKRFLERLASVMEQSEISNTLAYFSARLASVQ